METISARCLLCSKTYSVDESHKDYKNSWLRKNR